MNYKQPFGQAQSLRASSLLRDLRVKSLFLRFSVHRPIGRPPIGDAPKKQVTLRLDADPTTLSVSKGRFRATGKGWQSRINEALRKAAGI